jgi:hypothetical protein
MAAITQPILPEMFHDPTTFCSQIEEKQERANEVCDFVCFVVISSICKYCSEIQHILVFNVVFLC